MLFGLGDALRGLAELVLTGRNLFLDACLHRAGAGVSNLAGHAVLPQVAGNAGRFAEAKKCTAQRELNACLGQKRLQRCAKAVVLWLDGKRPVGVDCVGDVPAGVVIQQGRRK
ncbi:MAG: hypothetical protein ACO289_08600 [Prochlorococcaceae cyanobacterium]